MHDANMFGQQGMGHGPRTLTLRQSPTGRVIIVIVAERENKREESREREREKYEGKERRKRETRKDERKREGEERERERSPPLKNPPCVRAKRAHVEHMRPFCRSTRRRFEPTHGRFSACQAHTPHTTRHTHKHTHTHTNAWTRAWRATDRDLETKK